MRELFEGVAGLLRRIRPQVLAGVVGLTAIGLIALRLNSEPAVVGCITGIVAIAKDIISSEGTG
jgi:hypothetical protein